MSETAAESNAESGSSTSDSASASYAEAGEGEAPDGGAGRFQAANDDVASDDMPSDVMAGERTHSGGGSAQEDRLETGMSGPAKAADGTGAGLAANDDIPAADASQTTTMADKSNSSGGKWESNANRAVFNDVAGKKGGGAGGGGRDGGGDDGDDDDEDGDDEDEDEDEDGGKTKDAPRPENTMTGGMAEDR